MKSSCFCLDYAQNQLYASIFKRKPSSTCKTRITLSQLVVMSERNKITCGVPQESIPGPLLFNTDMLPPLAQIMEHHNVFCHTIFWDSVVFSPEPEAKNMKYYVIMVFTCETNSLNSPGLLKGSVHLYLV